MNNDIVKIKCSNTSDNLNVNKINMICYVSFGVLGIYISVLQNLIAIISQYYSTVTILTGFIILFHFAGSMIASAIMGEISDHIGKNAVIIISLIIYIIGLIITTIFHTLIFTCTGVFLAGCGFGAMESVLSGLLADINHGQVNKVINLSQMFFCIGAVLGPLISLWIIKQYGSWELNFSLLIIVLFIILLYICSLKFDTKLSESLIKGKCKTNCISLRMLRETSFILMCVSIFIYVGVEEGIAFWLTTYFDKCLQAKHLGSYALSSYWAGMIIGRYIGSRADEKSKLPLFCGLFTSLSFIIAALIYKNVAVNILCFFGVGLGFSVIWPILMSTTAKLYPEFTGTAVGLMMSFSSLGGVAFPFVMGIAGGFLTLNATFWLIPIMIIIIVLFQHRLYKDNVN